MSNMFTAAFKNLTTMRRHEFSSQLPPFLRQNNGLLFRPVNNFKGCSVRFIEKQAHLMTETNPETEESTPEAVIRFAAQVVEDRVNQANSILRGLDREIALQESVKHPFCGEIGIEKTEILDLVNGRLKIPYFTMAFTSPGNTAPYYIGQITKNGALSVETFENQNTRHMVMPRFGKNGTVVNLNYDFNGNIILVFEPEDNIVGKNAYLFRLVDFTK